MDSLAALVTAILTALGLAAGPGAPGPKAIPRGTIGYDISWPQCGKAYPAGSAFGVVGVTDGKPYFGNPCLASEFAWAAATPGGAEFYMNTANPGAASTAVNWYQQKAPDASCAPGHDAACAYNYGFNAAANAVAYAQAQTAHATGTRWWLDVETDNSWSPTDLGANVSSLRGSIDFLQRTPGVVVGIYSTHYQWTRIAGGTQLPLANWVAGATSVNEAKSRCTPAWSATGGPVVLTQAFGPFDTNYAC
jgi:hypothetical protein